MHFFFFNELFILLLCLSADQRDKRRGLVWLCAEMPLSKCHNTATASSEHLTIHLLCLCVCMCGCESLLSVVCVYKCTLVYMCVCVRVHYRV